MVPGVVGSNPISHPSTLASAGVFCASGLRLGGEPARSKFLSPRPGRRKQRPGAFPRFDSGASILRDLDEVARPVLNESSGIQVELGPGDTATIDVGAMRQFKNTGKTNAVFLRVQTEMNA